MLQFILHALLPSSLSLSLVALSLFPEPVSQLFDPCSAGSSGGEARMLAHCGIFPGHGSSGNSSPILGFASPH